METLFLILSAHDTPHTYFVEKRIHLMTIYGTVYLCGRMSYDDWCSFLLRSLLDTNQLLKTWISNYGNKVLTRLSNRSTSLHVNGWISSSSQESPQEAGGPANMCHLPWCLQRTQTAAMLPCLLQGLPPATGGPRPARTTLPALSHLQTINSPSSNSYWCIWSPISIPYPSSFRDSRCPWESEGTEKGEVWEVQ